MKTLALLMLIITVYCVDVKMDDDRCFSTQEKAATFCDMTNYCRGIYESNGREKQ